jgi:hypothetical protein
MEDGGTGVGRCAGSFGALTCILNVHITPKNGIQRSAIATRIKRISSIMHIAISQLNGVAVSSSMAAAIIRNVQMSGIKDYK